MEWWKETISRLLMLWQNCQQKEKGISWKICKECSSRTEQPLRPPQGTTVALSVVHTFLQLSVMASLLHKVQDLLRQSFIGHGPRC